MAVLLARPLCRASSTWSTPPPHGSRPPSSPGFLSASHRRAFPLSLLLCRGESSKISRNENFSRKMSALSEGRFRLRPSGGHRSGGRSVGHVARKDVEEEHSSIAQAVKGDSESDGGSEVSSDLTSTLASAGIFLLWGAFVAYAALLSPNATPYRDTYFLQKLTGVQAILGDDGFEMNHVLVALFFIMGNIPLIYSMLLYPTGRSSKGSSPIWPFSAASYAVGAFALLPYFALWRGQEAPKLPSPEEREGWAFKIFESKITAAVAAVGTLGLVAYAAFAGAFDWKEFGDYFRGSRFVHVMSLDFFILCGMAPFWVYNDMAVRKWKGRDTWLVTLAFLPLIGPAAYLLLRPDLPEAE